MKKFIIAVSCLAALILLPAAAGPTHLTLNKVGLSAVAMNGAAGTRTFEVPVGADGQPGAFSTVTFYFNFTHANNGIISLTCTGGPSQDTDDYTITVCDPASATGYCDAANAGILRSGTAALSASKKWIQRLNVLGVRSLTCVAAHSGAPAAGDKLTVTYNIITQ
jgi:hypothetical protein